MKQTENLVGNVRSSTEMIGMRDRKKQLGINSHSTQMDGEVRICLMHRRYYVGSMIQNMVQNHRDTVM